MCLHYIVCIEGGGLSYDFVLGPVKVVGSPESGQGQGKARAGHHSPLVTALTVGTAKVILTFGYVNMILDLTFPPEKNASLLFFYALGMLM